jgi:hypothetical protein
MWFFHPYGIMGFFGLAGTVGLWFVVPQNAFKSNFKPDKVHLTLLSLGALSAIPFVAVMIFYKNDDISSFMFCLVGPLVVSIKYLFQAFKNRYLTI